MERRKIIAIIGIVLFCLWVGLIITVSIVPWHINISSIYNFIDIPSILIVAVGGSILAFIKMPKNINHFLRYFSKTSILVGAIASIIEITNFLASMDGDPDSLILIAMALLTMFYGLIFSGIAYVLCRDEKI